MHTVTRVYSVNVSHVVLHPILVEINRKGEPQARLNGAFTYKFELDDRYPASFWLAREGQPVVIMYEIIDAEERAELGDLALHGVIDLSHG